MRLLLLADQAVGESVLDYLAQNFPKDLCQVVTTSENNIFSKSVEMEIPVRVFENSNLLSEYLSGTGRQFDLGLMAWWPKLIKKDLINLPKEGFINFHPSLLPYCRGKHYNFWTLVEQCPFGVTLHFVEEGVDCGDVVVQQTIPYNWTDTGETLYVTAQKAILDLFYNNYERLRSLDIPRKKQDLSVGSFHKAVELEPASLIDLDKQYSARDLINLIRARTFSGHPACNFYEGDDKYEVRISIERINK